MIESYVLHLLILIGIYSILATSLNLAMGFTGLFNLGHVAFYAIGAYTSALLALKLGFPFWFGLIIGGIFASLFAFITLPTLRLKGDYLALATMGLAIIIENILRNWISLTNGPLGLVGIPRPKIFEFTFSNMFSYFLLVLVIAVIVYVFIRLLVKSPFGRVLKAVRDDEVAAKTIGKNVLKYKTLALVTSAFFAGVAGSLYAHYISFIEPSSFSISESILILSMIIIGGFASVEGSVIGAIILILLPEPLRFLPLPSYAIGALRQILYALLLIVMIIKKPSGIKGEKALIGKG